METTERVAIRDRVIHALRRGADSPFVEIEVINESTISVFDQVASAAILVTIEDG